MLGQLLSLGGGLLGGAIQSGQTRKNIEQQARHNRELAEYSYSKDLEMWNRQNAYNAPTQQMARLREAGLNPHLVYGKGAVGNTAGDMPKYQQARTDYSSQTSPMQGLGILSQFQDLQMKNAQLDNVRLHNQHQQIQNEYAESILQGKAGRGWEQVEKLAFERGLRTGEDLYISPEGKAFRIKDTPAGQLYQSTLSKSQASVAGVEASTRLKHMQADWYNILKGVGIATQLAGPLSRILLGTGALRAAKTGLGVGKKGPLPFKSNNNIFKKYSNNYYLDQFNRGF